MSEPSCPERPLPDEYHCSPPVPSGRASDFGMVRGVDGAVSAPAAGCSGVVGFGHGRAVAPPAIGADCSGVDGNVSCVDAPEPDGPTVPASPLLEREPPVPGILSSEVAGLALALVASPPIPADAADPSVGRS